MRLLLFTLDCKSLFCNPKQEKNVDDKRKFNNFSLCIFAPSLKIIEVEDKGRMLRSLIHVLFWENACPKINPSEFVTVQKYHRAESWKTFGWQYYRRELQIVWWRKRTIGSLRSFANTRKTERIKNSFRLAAVIENWSNRLRHSAKGFFYWSCA